MITGEARMQQAMILALQGFAQREIGNAIGVTDRMVRYYLAPKERTTRSRRSSMLDPYGDFIAEVLDDQPYHNLELIRTRLKKLGYSGGITILSVSIGFIFPKIIGEPFPLLR
jgi:hypothetical protein